MKHIKTMKPDQSDAYKDCSRPDHSHPSAKIMEQPKGHIYVTLAQVPNTCSTGPLTDEESAVFFKVQ